MATCGPGRRGSVGAWQEPEVAAARGDKANTAQGCSHAAFTELERIFRRFPAVDLASMIRALALLASLALAPLSAAAVRTAQAEAELLSSESAWVPGRAQWLALRILHDAGWHTYWINPGDSGLPTRLEWSVPPGFTVSAPAWPRPVRIAVGPLTNFGYEGELLVPIRVEVAETVPLGSEQTLRLSAKWLICEEICIPDGAELEIRLKVAEGAERSPAAEAITRVVQQLPASWPGTAALRKTAEGFVLELAGAPQPLPDPELFPADPAFLEHARGQARWDGDRLQIAHARNPFFERLPEHPRFLLAAGPRREDPAWWVNAALATAADAEEPGAVPASAGEESAALGVLPWLLALLGAFAGGVLLNLMPCVFPVLSLKALGIAESAGEPRRLRRHGIFYTAGVLAGFAALGVGLLLLRAAGEAAGWGFQLQQPWFVGFLAWLMALLGLGLLGVFEVGTRLMGLGGQLSGEGARGAFLTGLLACVVASPCTAPFMGAALGLAATLPAAQALAVFLALGFGMAFPLLALSLLPPLARRLPRPGRWMERFKQAMGFPLLATALWLLWVLGHQAGVERMIGVLAAVLLAAFLLWLGGQGGVLRPLRWAGWALALWLAVWPGSEPGQARAPDLGEPFREARLAELIGQGRAVLVNMTADWCITCKVNERVALSGEGFQAALARHGVSYLIGDWTREDPEISRYLARFGRNGVPLYVLYPAGGGEPEVLPQILTPRLVEEALRRASSLSPPSSSSAGGVP